MAAEKGSSTAVGPVAKFCDALNQLRISSGLDVETLARKLSISRSQLYAILNGERKTPPDWGRLVRPLVEACTRGDKRAVEDAIEEWRRRHAILVEVHEELNRQQRHTPPAADPGTVKPAETPLDATTARPQEDTTPPPLPVRPPEVPDPIEKPRTPDMDRFAAAVLAEWTEEYDARKFNDTGYGLRVSWKAAEPVLMTDWEKLVKEATSGTGAQKGVRSDVWAGSAQELKGFDHELRSVLERVPTGWLVVLGEPGYGKSMLMIQLVIDLIRQRDSGAPVPVFVPMTTWNPEEDALEKWLEKQLPNDYPILGALVPGKEGKRPWIAELLAGQRIVPILDGLDEMPLVLQRLAVDRLNKSFARPDRPLHLVVTCRTTEYKAIVNAPGEPWNPVGGAAAVELRHFNGAEVAQYLNRDGKDVRWAGVAEELSDPTGDSALRKVLETPLYACLASAIYNPHSHMRGGAPDPEDLRTKFHDAASIQYHLLDEFIPSMYPDERKAEERRAREEKRQAGPLPAERRLMFIARYLKGRKSTTLEWWNLEGLAPRRLPAAVVGIVCGIAVGVAAGLGTHVGVGIGVGFGVGLLIAEAIGLGFRYARERWDKEGFDRRFARRRPSPGMVGGIIGAVLGGLGAGVAGRYHIGHEPSLFSGIPEGLGIAIGAGATTEFLGGLTGALIGSFVAGYLAAVGLGLPAGIVNGLGVGIAAALAIEYLSRRMPSLGPPVWERIGIPAGLIVGLVIGLMAWLEIGVIGGIVVALLIAAAAAVPLGMRRRDEEPDIAPSPGQALARDAAAFRLTALWAGLATGCVGFIGGAMTSIFEVGAKPGLTDIIRDGLGIGLSAGLAVGLCFGFYHAASPGFRIVNWWLACQGKVPLRFTHFLDDAHQKTVLRQTGTSYEFRHVILRDHLAGREER